jgi:hypothetical protein
MGIVNSITSWLSPTAREDRRARQMLEARVQQLATEYKHLVETVTVADLRPIMPWERYLDGNRLLFPSSQATDRQHGKNWPIVRDENDLSNMRAFSRILCETNGYAIGFRDHVRNFVLGSGFTWQVILAGQKTGATSIGDKDGDGQPDVDPDVAACQQVLDEFCRLNHWGDAGEATVSQDLDEPTVTPTNREREAYERAMEDGEFFVRIFPGDASTRGVPLIRFIEPELVKTPPNQSINSPWGFGIRSDAEDTETSIEVHIEDPRYVGQVGEIVPAGHIVHFKLNAKSTVKRGIPDFWPIEDEVQGSRTLVRNMLRVSGILAAIAYIRQHAPQVVADQVRQLIGSNSINPASPLPQQRSPWGLPGPDATSFLNTHQAGQIIDVSHQLQYVPGPINAGVPGFLQAQQAALRCVGLRWGCPEYFSGDASNANFASTLIAGGPFERATVTRQQDFVMCQQTLAIRVLLFAVKSGRLTREQVNRVAVKVTAPPVAIANRSEDTNRRNTLFMAKILSPQTWMVEEGLDPAVETANWRAWNEMFPDESAAGLGLGQDFETDPNDLSQAIFGEDKTNLTKRVITNKLGHQQTVYVDPNKGQGPHIDPTKPDNDAPEITLDDLDPETRQVTLSFAEKAVLKVYGIMRRVDSLVPTVQAALEGIFDTPEDMTDKPWYTPGMGTAQSAATVDLGVTSVSQNMFGLIMTKVVPAVAAKAWTKLRGKRRTEAEAQGGVDEGVALLVEIFATVLREFGVEDPESVIDKTVLREMLVARMA